MSTTASCTFNGHNSYNNGWNWTSFTTTTGYGWPGYGKDTNGNNRAIVLKFTTPSFSNAKNKQIQVGIPLCRDASGTDTWYYRVTTSVPTFSESGGTAVTLPSSYMASGSLSFSTSTSYTFKTITTDAADFQASTTYYIWFWSNTPTGSTVGYYGNSTSAGGTISVSLIYDKVTYSYYAPSVSLSGYSGFYGGASLTVSNNSSYPYIYVGNSASGTYWRKATSGTSISIDADTSSTSKTIYVVRVSADAGASFTYSGSAYTSFSVPRYACAVYNGSSSYTVYSGNSGTFTCSKSGYTFEGLATTSNTIAVDYEKGYYNSTFNGNIYYAVYSTTGTVYYYLGSSTKYTAYPEKYLYGKGSSTGWGLYDSPDEKPYPGDSDYTFVGWSKSSNSYSISYPTLISAYQNGVDTLYCVYSKEQYSTSESVYYYRGTSTRNSVTKTTTTEEEYIYGKGSRTGGGVTTSYGSISTSCAADSSASLVGWTSSSTSTTSSYSSAEDAFDDGYTTIYGIFKINSSSSYSTVYYYRGSSTKNSATKTTTTAAKYYYGTGNTSGGGSSTSYESITSSCASDSSYSLVGWATSSGTTSYDYTSATDAFNAGYSTIYGVYKKAGESSTSSLYYYRGTSDQNTVTKTVSTGDSYYYGTGQNSVGGTSTSYSSIDSSCAVSGWTLIGFSADASAQSSTSSATDLFDAGNTTIYGTYSLTESMTYYPENGSSSATVSVTNYRYGTGTVTSNYPAEPQLTNEEKEQLGWSTESGGAYSTWNELWDSGTRTVYAVWAATPVGNVVVYYGANGSWVPATVYYGVGSEWKEAPVFAGLWKT